MVTKVPSPFTSPFTKVLLAFFWLVYAALVIALVVVRDINLLILVAWWTAGLPWVTWAMLSGVQVDPGRSVGGGPLFARVRLEPNERILFNSPIQTGIRSIGHLFVTDDRVISSCLFGCLSVGSPDQHGSETSSP